MKNATVESLREEINKITHAYLSPIEQEIWYDSNKLTNELLELFKQKLLHPTEVKEPSKSAEDILKITHSFIDNTLGRCYEKSEVIEAMEEYAQQFLSESKQLVTEEEFLNMFLNFVDKKTYWKQDNDVTNSQVIEEFLKTNSLSLPQSVTNCNQNERKDEWISCKKRKPDFGIGVLIRMENEFITTAYRKETGPNETTWYVYHDNLKVEDVVITHWMPLPPFTQQSKSEE